MFLYTKLSSINQKRLKNFVDNRRGYFSFWIFVFLFGFSLLAEVFINDKPLLIRFEDNFFFPFIVSYPETEFEGDFETETDYRDPYIIEKINAKGWILWPLVPYSYDTIIKDIGVQVPSPPTAKNWLGTDDQARDVFARMVYGFRLSVFFALILSVFSLVAGIFMGAVQGYFGGILDLILQRFMEIWDSIPILYLLIIMTSIIEPNFWWLLLFMSLFSWMSYVGVVRAEFLRARNFDFVKAAKSLGVSDMKIIYRHVLPNALVATITFFPFNLSGAINILASLDFLGLGLPAPTPSLGELIYQGKNNLEAPWLGLTGFFTLATMLSLLIFMGEAVRDAFDNQKNFSK